MHILKLNHWNHSC